MNQRNDEMDANGTFISCLRFSLSWQSSSSMLDQNINLLQAVLCVVNYYFQLCQVHV